MHQFLVRKSGQGGLHTNRCTFGSAIHCFEFNCSGLYGRLCILEIMAGIIGHLPPGKYCKHGDLTTVVNCGYRVLERL